MLWLRAAFFFLLLPGVIAYVVPTVLGVRTGGDTPGALRALGAAFQLAGTVVLLWCVRDFAVRGRGTLAPVDPPKELVAAGLYRWVRNPMYVGVVTTLIGHALVFGSGALWIYAAAVFIGFHLFVTLYEEPTLLARFGESYARYRATVPRWLPRPPRAAG